jgi:4-amino-4-deoxy-L-arabinose transferase-like glycosyltransferase
VGAAENLRAPWPETSRRSLPPRYVAAGVGAVVAVAQIAADVLLRGRLDPLYYDGADYHRLAAGLAEHGAFGPPVADRPPTWPFLLAAVYRVFGVHPTVGLALNVVLAGLAAALVVLLAGRLGLGWRAAAAAGLAAGLCPWFLALGATLYTETAYTALVAALALLAVTARDRGARTALWAWIGLLTGVGLLLRPQLVLWLPFALCLAFAGRRPKAAVAFMGAVLVVLAPWTVRNYARLGAFVPFDTRGGATLASANNDLSEGGQSTAGLPRFPAGTEVENDETFRSAAIHWITADPARFVGRMDDRLVRTFDPTTRLTHGVYGSVVLRWTARGLWAVLMAFTLWGLVLHHRGPWLVPLSFLAATLLLVVVFGGGFRFLVPVVPFLSIWGVAGATDAVTALRRDPRKVDARPARG